MMKETMTVHKALAELKVLTARILDAMDAQTFVVANKHSNTKIGGKPVDEYCREVKETYQSLRTLINRRNAIKQAVILSNAATKVTIAGKEYTVAEAIDMKANGMDSLIDLRNRMVSQLKAQKTVADRENGDRLSDRTDAYIKSMYGATDLKNMSDEVQKTREAFIAAQTVELVDPLNAAKEAESLQNLIDAFTSEVDAALSVSNALTTVEFEYDTY